MVEVFSNLSDALSRISAAPATSIVWSALKDFSGKFGYNHVLVASAPEGEATLQESMLYADSRKHTIADLDRGRPYETFLVVERARKKFEPFSLSELKAETQDQSWVDFIPEGIKDGESLYVPIVRNGIYVAGALFSGPSPDISPLVRAALQVAAHCAYEALEELKNQKSPLGSVTLSVRETQCLSYIATGHEDEQISRLLGISPRTVRFHVDSAKAKLGVTSRVQAVTKALRERMITV